MASELSILFATVLRARSKSGEFGLINGGIMATLETGRPLALSARLIMVPTSDGGMSVATTSLTGRPQSC